MQCDWLVALFCYKLFSHSLKGYYRTSLVFNGVVPVHASRSHHNGGFIRANTMNSRYAMIAWYFTASDCSRRQAVDTGLTSADRKPVADEGKSFEARQLRTVSMIIFLISVGIERLWRVCCFVSEEEPKSLVSVRVAGLPVSTRSNGVVRPLSPNAPVAAPPAAAAPAPVAHSAPEPAPAPASFLDFVQEHSRPRTTSNSHGYVVLVLPVSETAGGFAFACSTAAAASAATASTAAARAVTTSLAHNDKDNNPRSAGGVFLYWYFVEFNTQTEDKTTDWLLFFDNKNHIRFLDFTYLVYLIHWHISFGCNRYSRNSLKLWNLILDLLNNGIVFIVYTSWMILKYPLMHLHYYM